MPGNPTAASVLVVDDDADVLRALVDQLARKLGCCAKVVGAQDAETALRMLARGRFRAIVADHRLPRASGLALLTAAKDLAPDATRILMTGDPEPRLAVHATTRGAAARCFIKPVDVDALTRVLRHAIERSGDPPRQLAGVDS